MVKSLLLFTMILAAKVKTYLVEVCRYQMTEQRVWSSLEVAGQQAHAWLSLLCLRILPLGISAAIKHQHSAQKSWVHYTNALGRVIQIDPFFGCFLTNTSLVSLACSLLVGRYNE